MKQDIILIGGGGHCKACIDVIEAENKFKIAGIIDRKERLHHKVLNYEIIGADEDLPGLAKENRNFLITIGQVKDADKRKDLFDTLKKFNAGLPRIISPNSYISKYSEIGEGTIILHGARINAGVKIGKNCIINTAAIIEHDAQIGDHCHISTGSIVNGGCVIGDGVFIGSKSVISHNISVANDVIIGAGSSVVKSISKSGTYAGNPARKLDKR